MSTFFENRSSTRASFLCCGTWEGKGRETGLKRMGVDNQAVRRAVLGEKWGKWSEMAWHAIIRDAFLGKKRRGERGISTWRDCKRRTWGLQTPHGALKMMALDIAECRVFGQDFCNGFSCDSVDSAWGRGYVNYDTPPCYMASVGIK